MTCLMCEFQQQSGFDSLLMKTFVLLLSALDTCRINNYYFNHR